MSAHPVPAKRAHSVTDIGTGPESLKQAKRRRPTDRTLPEFSLNIDSTDSELSGLIFKQNNRLNDIKHNYDALCSLERDVDWTISRKRTELAETLSTNRLPPVKRKLRVRISNTAQSQPWQESAESETVDFASGQGVPSWSMTIEGKLLNEAGDTEAVKFTHIVSHISVDIQQDRSNLAEYRDANKADWRRNPAVAPMDALRIQRAGSSNVPVKIALYVEQYPRRFKLSKDLAALVGKAEETKPNVMASVWGYIQKNKCVDSEDRRIIKCDQPLQKLLSADRLAFWQLAEGLMRHLTNPDPVYIDYTINVSEDFAASEAVYDIPVWVEDPSRTKIESILSGLAPNSATTAQLVGIDEEIAQNAYSARILKQKRSILTQFALDPKGYMQRWVDSQTKDLTQILGGSRGAAASLGGGAAYNEQARSREYWQSGVAEHAIAMHLQRQHNGNMSKR